jgi:chromosome segregation ATPase
MDEDLSSLVKKVKELEKSLSKAQRRLDRLNEKVSGQGNKVRSLEKRLDTRIRREAVLMEALGFTRLSKPGDKGFLDDLNDSILRLEEYLLRTSERIDNILSALKNHREFLVRVNKRMDKVGAKERMEMGLSIMKNTLSVLALSGVRFDPSLIADIENLQEALGAEGKGLRDLQKRKDALDKKFDGELRKFDLESIYSQKTDLPGYQ